LHFSESVLGANALALSSLSQALLLAEDLQLGVADESTVQSAVAEARRVLADLSSRTDTLRSVLGGAGSEFDAAALAALASGRTVASMMEAGDVAAAGELLAGDALSTFEGLRDVAAEHQQSAATGIESTSDFISKLGSFPAFLVALFVPGIAILIYRRIAKGQLSVAEAQLDARLEAEHEIVVAKDEFVASISHELRTPLTTIYGFSEILLDQGLVDPVYATELLTLINTESAELHRMVEDLLTTARSEAGTIAFQIAEVDLVAELEVNTTGMERTGLLIDSELGATKVWADHMRVRQIMRNLLSNADRHGGDRVRVTSTEVGDVVELVVADDGDGVPADKAVRLFTRYVHEGEDSLTVGSVGMGLAVVKILAEGMSGSVRYERQDGWSCFIVTLPSSEEVITSLDGRAGAGTHEPDGVFRHQIAASQPLEEGWPGIGAP
ncbi:MAG: HAMP domain-containing histidine kinase, partial [Acidobacteriota bacterium]|nr:HAMP domain-containing histidine kinase [Acidobacteriota bacterium]